VVGPVPAGFGVLGHASLTDGSLFGAIVSGVPGARWYDHGRVVSYFASSARAREMLLKTPDTGAPLVEEALAQAGLAKQDINFWASHQGTAWLSRVMHDHLSLKAKTLDTYRQTASLSGANVPFILHAALQEGMLQSGDVVALWSAAAGLTMTGMVLRWAVH
jgi:3-oxoacyl-[acyl-carrier-protein] synthase III